MTALIVVAVVVAAIVVVVVAAIVMRPGQRPMPADPSWRWEGIRLALAEQGPADDGEPERGPAGAGAMERRRRPRLVIRGEYMAGQAVYRAAVSDWAFTHQPTPIVVMFDVGHGVEIHRASLDRIRGERLALVEDLSISYAMPSPPPPVPDDETRREGGPFSVDIGFYLEPRDEPWELRVHAELGPLRSESITIAIPARGQGSSGR